MSRGGGAVIGSFIWVLRVRYEAVAGYHPVLASQSFQPLEDGTSTGYVHLRSRYSTKPSVQHVRAVHTSAESSLVRLFFLLIPVLPGTPQYGIYADRTVIADLMETHCVLCPNLTCSRRYEDTPSRRTATEGRPRYPIHPVSSPIVMVMASI